MTQHTQHFERYIQPQVTIALSDTPVVFIMGARQSGKTTLAKSMMRDDSWAYFNLDDAAQFDLVQADPIGFIKNLSHPHVIIDEIQRAPSLLLAIKQSVDENRQPGRFLLTGSANAMLLPKVADSLAGRIETIRMHTLSECEIHGTPPSFLKKILAGEHPTTPEIRIKQTLIERIVRGGFPTPVLRTSESRAQAWHTQYIQSLIQKDITDLDQIDHPEKISTLLQLLAFYSGKLINFTDLGNKLKLNSTTIKRYINLLEQLFLMQKLPAWHTNAYKRLVKTPKCHLQDTGMICALRNIQSETLRQQPDLYGHLVETFVINELQKQADWSNQHLQFYHYRDKDQCEIDCIIENVQGDCFAIEIKASATIGSKDFKNLKRLREMIGERFKMGVLLYDGDLTNALDDTLLAAPLGTLWA